VKCANSTLPMSPVATEIETAGGGACPTTCSASIYTGNYTTISDASSLEPDRADRLIVSIDKFRR
jgi:hypothetical protein